MPRLLPFAVSLAAACALFGCRRERHARPAEWVDPDPPPARVELAPAVPFAAWAALTNESEVASAVRPGLRSAAAELVAPGEIAMPVDFTGSRPPVRQFWDFRLNEDLSKAEGLDFEFRVDRLDCVSRLSVYLKSGAGWYASTFHLARDRAWERIRIPRKSFAAEGKCTGWQKIETVRFAVWRSGGGVTDCYARRVAPIVICSDHATQGRAQKLVYEVRARSWLARRKPAAGERRAIWCHSAWAAPDRDWETAAANLARLGVTDVFANFAWGGTAFYKSSVLPVARGVSKRGDQLALCRKSCDRHRLKCHAWKVCWYLGNCADKSFSKLVASSNRIQRTRTGAARALWLCPSNPENRRLEIESALEMARCGVDGVHLDYIRHSGRDACFCNGCRRRFESSLGRAVTNFPAALAQDASLRREWSSFRAELISSLVSNISVRIRAESPQVELSVAVYAAAEGGADAVGQDWPRWCREGWVDFVCPMAYVQTSAELAMMIRDERRRSGNVPVWPGIGLVQLAESGSDDIDVAIAAASQIETARQLGCRAFSLFSYDSRCRGALELMKSGN